MTLRFRPCENLLMIQRFRKLFQSAWFGTCNLQATVDHELNWSNANNFKLSSLKCKELRIDFRKKANVDIPALEVNTYIFETVKSAKELGVTLRDDPKWKDRVDKITAKAGGFILA